MNGEFLTTIEGVRVNQFGFVIMPSLNITIDSNLYLGIEGGLGYNYINNYDVDVDPKYEQDPSVSGMFRCNLGYRF